MFFSTRSRQKLSSLACVNKLQNLNSQRESWSAVWGSIRLDTSGPWSNTGQRIRLTFDECIIVVIRVCNFHLLALCHIRHLIDREATNTIACSIDCSYLVHCNSILYGVTNNNIAIFSVSRMRWRGWYVAHHIIRQQRYFDAHYTGCPSSRASHTKWQWWPSRSIYTSNPCTSPNMLSTTNCCGHFTCPGRICWPSQEPIQWSCRMPSAQWHHICGTACHHSRILQHPLRYFEVVSRHSCLTSPTMIINDLSHSATRTRCTETSPSCGNAVKLMAPGDSKINVIWLIENRTRRVGCHLHRGSEWVCTIG